MADKQDILPAGVRADIDRWAKKYPPKQRQSAILPALLRVQAYNQGWLSNELIEATAAYLNMPAIAAFEVATFYSMYDLTPVGRHKISICTNISCMLSGADELACHVKQRLGIEFGETTADGLFTLKEVECLAACAAAPACQIDRTYHERVTPEKMDAILTTLAGDTHG